MTLDDISEGTTQTLTLIMDRLFRVAGCDPACHACHTVIKVGDNFKLAMHLQKRYGFHHKNEDREPQDIMFCGECTVEDLVRIEANAHRCHLRYRRENLRAGYSRPSKVTVLEGQEKIEPPEDSEKD